MLIPQELQLSLPCSHNIPVYSFNLFVLTPSNAKIMLFFLTFVTLNEEFSLV